MSKATATCKNCNNTVVLLKGVESGFCPRCSAPMDIAPIETEPRTPTMSSTLSEPPTPLAPPALAKSPSSETEPFEAKPYEPAQPQQNPATQQLEAPRKPPRKVKPWIIAAAAVVVVALIVAVAFLAHVVIDTEPYTSPIVAIAPTPEAPEIESVAITYSGGEKCKDLRIYIHDTVTLKVSYEPSSANAKITWISSNAKVIRVVQTDEAGTSVECTGVSTGHAALTVRVGDIEESCTVNVQEELF